MPRGRIELPTLRSSGERSTNELPRHILHRTLSQFGSGWLFRRLPLCWPARRESFTITLVCFNVKGRVLVYRMGIEPMLTRIKSPPLNLSAIGALFRRYTALHPDIGIGVPPTSYLQCIIKVMVNQEGIEPTMPFREQIKSLALPTNSSLWSILFQSHFVITALNFVSLSMCA